MVERWCWEKFLPVRAPGRAYKLSTPVVVLADWWRLHQPRRDVFLVAYPLWTNLGYYHVNGADGTSRQFFNCYLIDLEFDADEKIYLRVLTPEERREAEEIPDG